MIGLRFMRIAFCVFLLPGIAFAAPQEDTCRLLKVLGSNDGDAIPSLLSEIAPAFSAERGAEASNQLKAMLGAPIFRGGSAWLIGSMGDDLEEHLLLLRLRDGEVAGARVRYEWYADGMSIVSLEFHRNFAKYAERPFLQPPEPILCE